MLTWKGFCQLSWNSLRLFLVPHPALPIQRNPSEKNSPMSAILWSLSPSTIPSITFRVSSVLLMSVSRLKTACSGREPFVILLFFEGRLQVSPMSPNPKLGPLFLKAGRPPCLQPVIGCWPGVQRMYSDLGVSCFLWLWFSEGLAQCHYITKSEYSIKFHSPLYWSHSKPSLLSSNNYPFKILRLLILKC